MNTNDTRLVELEMRVAFQEEALAELNTALYQQQLQLTLLQRKLDHLLEDSQKQQESPSSASSQFEIPPHY